MNKDQFPATESPRGGPQSPAGRQKSRCNAIRHGLSADTLLPDVLGRALVEEAFGRLVAEWQPATPTQEYFVRELARHQAALARVELMEQAVLRRGARGALGLLDEECDTDDERLDAMLAGSGTSDALERITRYRRTHERAVLKSLAALRDLRLRAAAAPVPPPAPPPPAFTREDQCQAYLIARQRDRGMVCPRCDGRQLTWIAGRQVWQCRGCRRQMGIRWQTVMAGSRVGLLAWFRAIELLLRRPQASAVELSTATGIERPATLRRLAARIRQALATQTASEQLAGLDRYFAQAGV
jgi:hypothetical protein